MRLVPCVQPTEPLDSAPRTALLRDLDAESRWEGFWSRSSDAYYARCTAQDGGVEWFQMADEAASPDVQLVPDALTPVAHVIPFRTDAMRRVSLIVAESPSGRPIVMGSSRRATRQ